MTTAVIFPPSSCSLFPCLVFMFVRADSLLLWQQVNSIFTFSDKLDFDLLSVMIMKIKRIDTFKIYSINLSVINYSTLFTFLLQIDRKSVV